MKIIFKPDPIPEGEGTFEETVKKPLDTLTQTEQGTFSKWKTTIMNQLLLNKEVHVYDYANAEPMLCDMFNGVPCCRPRDDFRAERGEELPEDVQKWQKVWAEKKKKIRKCIAPRTLVLNMMAKMHALCLIMMKHVMVSSLQF